MLPNFGWNKKHPNESHNRNTMMTILNGLMVSDFVHQHGRSMILLMAIKDKYCEACIAKLRERVAQLGIDNRVSSEICLVWLKGDKPR
jgi:hypothetical protein